MVIIYNHIFMLVEVNFESEMYLNG